MKRGWTSGRGVCSCWLTCVLHINSTVYVIGWCVTVSLYWGVVNSSEPQCDFLYCAWCTLAMMATYLRLVLKFPLHLYKKKKNQIFTHDVLRLFLSVIDCYISRGGYRKPRISDVVCVQLILLPYHILKYVAWWVQWVWKFNIKKEEYGREEKLHIIRKYLGLNQLQFEVSMGMRKTVFLCEYVEIQTQLTLIKFIYK